LTFSDEGLRLSRADHRTKIRLLRIDFADNQHGAVAKWLRQRIANPSRPGSNPGGASFESRRPDQVCGFFRARTMRPRLQPSFEFGLTISNLSAMLFAGVV
jgi:hypothetical protein